MLFASRLVVQTTYLNGWLVAAKSMLKVTSQCPASRLSSSVLQSKSAVAGCSSLKHIWSIHAKRAVRIVTARGPQQPQSQGAGRPFCVSTLIPRGQDHPLVQSLKHCSRAPNRQTIMTNSQTPQAVAPHQQQVNNQRAHQQPAEASDAILPEADVAVQPFLISSSEQAVRARVDYSRGQRPLQVYVVGGMHMQRMLCFPVQ